jgi:hypothetical protein
MKNNCFHCSSDNTTNNPPSHISHHLSYENWKNYSKSFLYIWDMKIGKIILSPKSFIIRVTTLLNLFLSLSLYIYMYIYENILKIILSLFPHLSCFIKIIIPMSFLSLSHIYMRYENYWKNILSLFFLSIVFLFFNNTLCHKYLKKIKLTTHNYVVS